MKYFWGIILTVALFTIILVGATGLQDQNNNEFIRIHIVANSNSQIDQNIKYKVKDEIVDFLVPYISECESKADIYNTINEKMSEIEKLTNNILNQSGFNYFSKAQIGEEYCPNRAYDGFVVEEGFYDVLTIKLGNSKGDNWWCVLYPPLCFANSTSWANVKYKSRIIEIINYFK